MGSKGGGAVALRARAAATGEGGKQAGRQAGAPVRTHPLTQPSKSAARRENERTKKKRITARTQCVVEMNDPAWLFLSDLDLRAFARVWVCTVLSVGGVRTRTYVPTPLADDHTRVALTARRSPIKYPMRPSLFPFPPFLEHKIRPHRQRGAAALTHTHSHAPSGMRMLVFRT